MYHKTGETDNWWFQSTQKIRLKNEPRFTEIFQRFPCWRIVVLILPGILMFSKITILITFCIHRFKMHYGDHFFSNLLSFIPSKTTLKSGSPQLLILISSFKENCSMNCWSLDSTPWWASFLEFYKWDRQPWRAGCYQNENFSLFLPDNGHPS